MAVTSFSGVPHGRKHKTAGALPLSRTIAGQRSKRREKKQWRLCRAHWAGFSRSGTHHRPPGFNRWLVPPAALAIHLCIGMAYGFSVFWLPLSQGASA